MGVGGRNEQVGLSGVSWLRSEVDIVRVGSEYENGTLLLLVVVVDYRFFAVSCLTGRKWYCCCTQKYHDSYYVHMYYHYNYYGYYYYIGDLLCGMYYKVHYCNIKLM